jgi:hypothetical protein
MIQPVDEFLEKGLHCISACGVETRDAIDPTIQHMLRVDSNFIPLRRQDNILFAENFAAQTNTSGPIDSITSWVRCWATVS